MTEGTRLSVVIPALDEAAGIRDIVERVLGTRDRLSAAGISGLEVIVVDDGSTDGTAELASAVHGVTVLRHSGNRGYGAAIKTGFRAASGELLAFLDADGTYPPEALPDLCQALFADRADLVVGSRMTGLETGMPLTRRIGNWFFARLVSLVGATAVSDSASGERVLRRDTLHRLYPLPDGLNFTPAMTTRALHEGVVVVEVPIRYQQRTGRSKLSVLHDGRRFLSIIVWTALAYNPSRILGSVGLTMLACAGAIGLALVAMRAAGITSLGPWGVAGAFATLVLGVAGTSLANLGITFNYLVGLFHDEPIRQGLFGRPVLPGLDRWFGRLGVAASGVGIVVAVTSLALGLSGWDITRLWLWLLGSALLLLTGLQLVISWVLMRVLEELSVRPARATADMDGTL